MKVINYGLVALRMRIGNFYIKGFGNSIVIHNSHIRMVVITVNPFRRKYFDTTLEHWRQILIVRPHNTIGELKTNILCWEIPDIFNN